MIIAHDKSMVGKLRLNSNDRWEIVDISGNRVEITSGDIIKVLVGEAFIETRIESGWNDATKESYYYAVTPGVKLYQGQTAEIENFRLF